MKIDFKGLGGEKINYSDLYVDGHGNVFQLSTEGYLYSKSDVVAHPAKPKKFRRADKTVDLTGNTKYKW